MWDESKNDKVIYPFFYYILFFFTNILFVSSIKKKTTKLKEFQAYKVGLTNKSVTKNKVFYF